ncbi:hypothetical protein ACNKHL_25650 [Shigella flexneri]
MKRDAEELKRLGAGVADVGKNALDQIPLDADLTRLFARPAY